ncbi:DUF4889 domain-containing protein [Staphylococcus simiae]|uniref:DUF4889 domain-containing protein n=1 Tax=Staphylococcus simiae TaxID=308354 RepID=UPI001A968FE4|nr:DUF4889 domain-containing protein [Staphylococcus simiae]MBO1197850.1 DUF4889 domain-containing protein [Staphylococcus simiae]MBO1200041.1 DUF4889 domain-containing protein [Staphylococcus simiae]MBO1202314.1 DUF4889 domain-containing protein [Staphylococcus simiae]MBO1209841.1 DUF4889 domain-containing protein [Staphylococcus simiae]MBO1228458.1 DUF4889 domain-containing protein [Staphylococcus simiae]
MSKKMGIGLSAILLIIGIVIICMMVFSSQKTTYYGYMSNSTTAEKVVSEKDGLVKHNVKIDTDSDFKPKKGDFVKLISKDDGKTFYKKDIVKHDDIPHGLMMKIHEMHMSMNMQ